ncbi:hypothetical protein D3C79_1117620 [compost metagenome]
MVGHDQQAAGGGNPRQRGGVHVVATLDEIQSGGDEVETAPVGIAAQELLDPVQP